MAESTRGRQDTAVSKPPEAAEPPKAAVPKREENELSDDELEGVSGGITDVTAGRMPTITKGLV